MALSYTYDRLLDIAAEAVGLARENLSAAELVRLGEVVNEACSRIAIKRTWLHLVKDLTLALVANDTYVLLPADFLRFHVDSEITYAPGQAYGRVRIVDMSVIRGARMPGTISGAPNIAALGSSESSGADRGRRRLEFFPTSDGTYSWKSSYYRLPATMSETTDTPDFPVILHPAVRLEVQIGAKEEWNQAVPGEWIGRSEQCIAEAAAALGNEARMDSAGLCTVVGGDIGAESGIVRELDVSGLELLP